MKYQNSLKEPLPNNFCSRPWDELHIEEDGKVTPCCVMPSNLFPMGNSLKDYYAGQPLEDLKQSLLNNERHPNCEWCWKNEDLGLKSHRNNSKPIFNISSIHIRMSNVCNFKCRMCNPSFSSSWAIENNKHKVYLDFVGEVLETNVFKSDTNLLPLLSELIKKGSLRHISISGGEPLLSEANLTFLDFLIENNLSQYITLSYSTNLSKLTYKGVDFIQKWKKFKQVSLEVSIDGWGSQLEYGRTGCDSKTLFYNLIKVKPLVSAINCVVNMYSVWTLPVLEKLATKLQIPIIYSPCYYPNYLNPQILPQTMKEELRTTYTSQDLTNLFNSFIVGTDKITFTKDIKTIEGLQSYFIEYNLLLDKYRNSDLYSTFPIYKNLEK